MTLIKYIWCKESSKFISEPHPSVVESTRDLSCLVHIEFLQDDHPSCCPSLNIRIILACARTLLLGLFKLSAVSHIASTVPHNMVGKHHDSAEAYTYNHPLGLRAYLPIGLRRPVSSTARSKTHCLNLLDLMSISSSFNRRTLPSVYCPRHSTRPYPPVHPLKCVYQPN